MNKSRFSRVEERIQQLVEGTFARLFVGRLQAQDVATRLAHALEDNTVTGSDGRLMAPNHFVVALNPEDYNVILAEVPDISISLANTVVELAREGGTFLQDAPEVLVVADSDLQERQVGISARYEDHTLRATQTLRPISSDTDNDAPAGPRNAQLILRGTTTVPLDRTIINIGRKDDNQIVIGDPRVSRKHAQIRLRFGRYVLYDLGSSGGTFVNNNAVQESILKPGDVISLAGVTMVYVEDETAGAMGDMSDGPGTKTEINVRRPPDLIRPDEDSSEDFEGPEDFTA